MLMRDVVSAWGVRCCSKIVSASSVLRLRFKVAVAFVEAVADFFAAATVALGVLDLVARVGLSSVWTAERVFASLVLARGLIGIDFFFFGFGEGGVDASNSL